LKCDCWMPVAWAEYGEKLRGRKTISHTLEAW
jgi:hypothetical protein